MRARVDAALTLDAREVPPKVVERLCRTLSFPNPAFLDRLRLGLNPGAEFETVCFVEQRGDELRLPRGAIGVLRRAAAQDGLIVACDDARVVPEERVEIAHDLTLRDYQTAVIDKLEKVTQGVAVMPCGSGKTIAGVGAIARLQTPTLVLVHTLDLADQWLGVLKDKLGVDAGLIGDGEERAAPVTVAVIQALVRWEASKLNAFLGGFGMMVVDECLPADARVIVRDRGPTPIADVVRSDVSTEVLSFDHERNTAEFRAVTGTSAKLVQRRFVTLTIRRNRRDLKLRVTEEHRVFVAGRGYVPAISVRPREHVLAVANYYPCPECDSVFEHRAAIAGHINCRHRGGAEKLVPARHPGGFCPRCGKIYATRGALQLHIRRHEDPELDARMRRENSARIRNTNLRCAAVIRERMLRSNPMAKNAVAAEKARRAHWVRLADAYKHLDGGNGAGRTAAESALLDCLGAGWSWQLVVRTGAPRGSGLPNHFKLDVGHVDARVAVELDGRSHYGQLARERDARKDQWLTEHGWTVRRFKNEEVLRDPAAAARAVEELVSCRA